MKGSSKLESARGKFDAVVAVDVKRVELVRVGLYVVLFAGLLEENEDVFGVFDTRSDEPGPLALRRLELG